ncbi:MAG: hypothetical protein MZV64_53270 [Ignavibacteriales bacterium]|nr:hypothetical protein [Ignavibacteriales bacterium]
MTINTTRTHFQNPWGNSNGNNVVSIYAKPDVDLTAELPTVEPDVVVPNGAAFADPVIDGNPNESVWAGAYSFDLGWEIETLRQELSGSWKIYEWTFSA